MFTKKYVLPTIITSPKIKHLTAHTYHIELIEAMGPLTISSGNRILTLKKYDILLTRSFKDVACKSNSPTKVNHLGIEINYPSPLNQFLIADNPLIHDLMNDQKQDLTYIVFTNLEAKICHVYLKLLALLIAQPQSDDYLVFEIERVFGLLLTELLRDHRNKISKNQSDFPSRDVKHASFYTQSGAIMSYITNKNGNVSLQTVADHFGYQKNYLSRLCKKLFDQDFIHLRRNIRMELACEQLKLTTKSIEEISDELGYKDVSAFSRQFNELKGITPNQYRRKYTVIKKGV